MIEFVVRYVTGIKDTVIIPSPELHLDSLSTNYIRQQIRLQNPQLAKKRLKLLHNGKVLLAHGDFSKDISYLKANLVDLETNAPIKIYIHCIIGDDLTNEELSKEEELDHQPEKSTTEAPRGFDRLLTQGFSNNDISDLRRQFFQIHGANLPNSTDVDALRNLEDRWIDSTVNNEIDEFPTNLNINSGDSANNNTEQQEPTDMGIRSQLIRRESSLQKELFLGVCVGFALGGFALLLLFLDIGGIFGKKTRMAVVSGVIVNLSFGVLRAWS